VPTANPRGPAPADADGGWVRSTAEAGSPVRMPAVFAQQPIYTLVQTAKLNGYYSGVSGVSYAVSWLIVPLVSC
jgi:hypothetical protein